MKQSFLWIHVHNSCSFNDWPYAYDNFNKTLTHIGDKHRIQPWFSNTCGTFKWTRRYANLQSSWKHVKDKDPWLYDIYFRLYDRGNYKGNSNEEDLNMMPEPVRGLGYCRWRERDEFFL